MKHQILTLQVRALLRPEPGTGILHPAGQGYLQVLRNDLLCLAQGALGSLFAHEGLHPLYAPMAVMESLGDSLREALDLALVGSPCARTSVGVVVEPGQDVSLVQALQLSRLVRDARQRLVDLVRDVRPARREDIHLDHRIAAVVGVRRVQAARPMIVECAGRQEPSAVLVAGAAHREAIREAGARPARAIPCSLGRVVGV